MLQGSFAVGDEGSVVSEEEVTEQLLKCFCANMQSPEVKLTDVKTVADVYSTVIVKVFFDQFKHHAEKDAEQSRCHDTTLYHDIDDGKGSREVAVLYSSIHIHNSNISGNIVNNNDELQWTNEHTSL